MIIYSIIGVSAILAAVSSQHYEQQYKTVIHHEQPNALVQNAVLSLGHRPQIVYPAPILPEPTHAIITPQAYNTASLQSYRAQYSPVGSHSLVPVRHPAPVYEHTDPVVHRLPINIAPAQKVVVPQERAIHHRPIQNAPVQQVISHQEHNTDNHVHPQYSFEYRVDDPHTGDSKYQRESRDGDVVRGVYGLREPDGSIRAVEYSADGQSGFIAQVKTSTNHGQA